MKNKNYIRKEKKMPNESVWQTVGQLVIDSGVLAICDPFLKETAGRIDDAWTQMELEKFPPIMPIRNAITDLGVLARHGDGVYKIEARMRKGIILEIRIIFD